MNFYSKEFFVYVSYIYIMIYDHLHSSLLIITTYDCNLACTYCYENKLNERCKEYMMEDMADTIVLWLSKLYEKRGTRVAGVTYYGGEPLLNLRIIKYLSNKLLKMFNERGIKYNYFRILTNGVLLTKKLLNV